MPSASGRTKLSTLRAKYPRELEDFDREVKDYCDAYCLDDAGYQWRSEVRDFIYDQVVCTVFKPDGAYTASLHLVGSSVNGCGLRNSDMDLCLVIAEKSGIYPTHKSFVVGILGMLREALRSSSAQVTFGKLQLLKTAKVPILKFTVSCSGKTLSVDICVNQFASIDNTRLLRHYAELDERFPMLCVLVKLWARSSGLNDAWRKTFNSYALNLLVLHYLVSAAAPPVLPNLLRLYPEFFAPSKTIDDPPKADSLPSPLTYEQHNTQSIGELMLGFFNHYSHFAFPGCAISVVHGACVSRTGLPLKKRYDLIAIDDPYQELNPARHITGRTFTLIMKALRSTLSELLSQATAPIVESEPVAPDVVNDDTSADGEEYYTAESDDEVLRPELSRKLPREQVSNDVVLAQHNMPPMEYRKASKPSSIASNLASESCGSNHKIKLVLRGANLHQQNMSQFRILDYPVRRCYDDAIWANEGRYNVRVVRDLDTGFFFAHRSKLLVEDWYSDNEGFMAGGLDSWFYIRPFAP